MEWLPGQTAIWPNGEVPADRRLANVTPKGQKEDLGCQWDLSAWEGHGTEDHPERHHVACMWQPGAQAQTTWVYDRQVLLDQPDPPL